MDDDGDGDIDCADTDCAFDPACTGAGGTPTGESDCTDQLDNDGDGDIDCSDADCASNLCCSIGPLFECDCTDGLDNDGNGSIDCAETVCSFDPSCSSTGGTTGGTENCTDLVDNDGDGDVNCDDSDCALYPSCYESSCDNGVDEDGDGDIDCADLDCAFLCSEGNCSNSADDDRDGDIDCLDSDCVGTLFCGESDCYDGIDNDGDGNTDCTDSECYSETSCQIFDFAGTYPMNLLLTDNSSVTDDCVGTLNLTLTTDGYNHAIVNGSGTCTSSVLGTITANVQGESFQVSTYNATINGLVVHTMSNGDRFNGTIVSGNIIYDSATLSTTLQIIWNGQLPAGGTLFSTSGEATY
jgi:hypothetical protein